RQDVPDADAVVTATLVVNGFEAASGATSAHRLVTSAELDPGDFMNEKAIVALGEKIEVKNSILEGNVLLGNDNERNWFWEPGDKFAGDAHPEYPDWYLREKPKKIKDKNYKFKDTEFRGTLYTRDEDLMKLEGDTTTGEIKVTDRAILAPSFDLSFYEDPSDDVVIFEVDPNDKEKGKDKGEDDYRKFKHLDLHETAVFIVERGQKLEFTDVDLRGGMVIIEKPKGWFDGKPDDKEYSYLDKAETKVEFKGVNRIGGGEDGVSSSLGILAPTAKVKSKKDWTTQVEIDDLMAELAEEGLDDEDKAEIQADLDELRTLPKKDDEYKDKRAVLAIEGGTWVNEFEAKKTNFYLDGQLIVTGKKTKIEDAFVKYGQDVVKNPPPGLEFLKAGGEIRDRTIHEAYGFDEDQLRDDLFGGDQGGGY
ncbi:MAG TPA: hypothetical protein VGC54_00955, partial [Planctomycetota bacterium]